MTRSNGNERTIMDALRLLEGWVCMLGGVGILVFSSFSEWKAASTVIGIGALLVMPVYYREHRERLRA
ncbi:MAG TPA: hypothetical protein VIM11_13305 [Tepidisphaeraceae bacterium]|jgi:energy-converting hydrogenase Eha subunit C